MALLLLVLIGLGLASADSTAINFETYALGSINGQDGWTSTGSYDHAVSVNTSGFASFGSKSLRISDAVTSGSFGDQTFAKPLINSVGETASTAGPYPAGSKQNHFEMQFDIAAAVPTFQPGMHVSVSPDRGDGSRMSYIRFDDDVTGIKVYFDDVQGATNPANFVEVLVGTLNRERLTESSSTLDTVNGPSNDVVKVYIDNVLVHTGTSWENYYRYDAEASAEQSPRIVRTVLFRTSGPANAADAGRASSSIT